MLFVPTLFPFSFHWYDGELPPLVGVAVNVTLVPVQMALSASLEEILTDAGRFGLMVTSAVSEMEKPPAAVTVSV